MLVATNTAGSALQLDGGSVDLFLSSSVLSSPGGMAAYLGTGNSGLLVLSTNTIFGGLAGVMVDTQTAGTQVWITSNTIVPSVTSLHATIGLYIDGLTSGATIENNTIAYRAPGTMGLKTSAALYVQSSPAATTRSTTTASTSRA